MFKSKKKKEFEKYRIIIEKSRLFDSSYYLKHHHDARVASETPIDHFVKYGLEEDRKPNKDFDPVWYREYYVDIKKDGGYPFIHYILYGKKERRKINEKNEKRIIHNHESLVLLEQKVIDLEEKNFDLKQKLNKVEKDNDRLENFKNIYFL